MRQAVIDQWHEFSQPLEGRVHWMYLDVLGLVTAGVGNLADPISLALQMPWVRLDGTRATAGEVEANWHRIKARQDLAKRHFAYAKDVTTVRLTDEGIDEMVMRKLRENEEFMRSRYFPAWDEFPADAQLGISSMAWACGPGFPAEFKNFRRFAAAQQWLEAKAACTIREAGNPGVIPRNKANRLCFFNAATVLRLGLDPEILHWPGEAPSEVDHSAETDPAIPVFQPDPNLEAVNEQRDADIDEEDTHPETPEAKG